MPLSTCGGYKPIVKMWLTFLNNYVNYGRVHQRANHAYKAMFWCGRVPFGQVVDFTISLTPTVKAEQLRWKRCFVVQSCRRAGIPG